MAYLRAGTRLEKSPTSGYILASDIEIAEPIRPGQLEVYGDAELPVAGEIVPKWLGPAIKKARENK